MIRQQTQTAVFPFVPETETAAEDDSMLVLRRFMRHLQHVPNNRMEIRILSSIQFTSDMLDHSDAYVAKMLVDMGLRAPRMAFPASFLEFTDNALMRSGWEAGGPSSALLDLKAYWDRIGEDKFAGFRRQYSLLEDSVSVKC